jgi:hypothetical protein
MQHIRGSLFLTLWLLLAGTPLAAGAAIGDIDPGYGQGGRSSRPAIPLGDGRSLYPTGTGYGRLDAAGLEDNTFGTAGVVAWPAGFTPNWKAWVRTPGGGILLGGSSGTSGAVLRLDAAGHLDTGLPHGVALLLPTRKARTQVLDLAIRADGRLLVFTGEFYAATYFDTPVQVIARCFDAALVPDRAFGTDGEAVMADYSFAGNDAHYEVYTQEFSLLADGGVARTDEYTDSASFLPGLQPRTYLTYLDRNGRLSGTPLPPGLDPGAGPWRQAAALPDGGMLADTLVSLSTHSQYRLVRLTADGQADPTFGNNGQFTMDVSGASQPGVSGVSVDGQFFYLALEATGPMSILRIHLQGSTAGQLDAGFGDLGVVRIGPIEDLRALEGLADGAVLVATLTGSFRLQGAPAAGAGILSLPERDGYVAQPGVMTVLVSRTGGAAGEVRVDYTVSAVARPEPWPSAIPGTDFMPASGQLVWADGETGPKPIDITLLPHLSFSNGGYRPIAVSLENPAGALWIEIPVLTLYNSQSWRNPGPGAAGAAPTSPVAGGPATAPAGAAQQTGRSAPVSGGAGSADLLLMLLAGLLYIRSAGCRPRDG